MCPVVANGPVFSPQATDLDGFTWLFPARLETSLCPRYAGRSKRLDFDPFNG
jgi:hypothetical protein